MTPEEFKSHENTKLWHIFFSALFPALMFAAGFWLYDHGKLPDSISFFDLALLILATFRLTRLVSYDAITLFFRELFMRKEITIDLETGERTFAYVEEPQGFKRSVSMLLQCPWCVGVWIALGCVFVYYAFPESWAFFLVLAIAGAASSLQVLANLLGWHAEYKKKEVREKFGD